jgi:hypothetical protein
MEVSAGDTILLPVVLVNATEEPINGGAIEVWAGSGLDLDPDTNKHAGVNLPADTRVRRIVPIAVQDVPLETEIKVLSKAEGGYVDNIVRKTRVAPLVRPLFRMH